MVSIEPNFAHLLSLSGPLGTFEHARYDEPRPEHGYCTDDVARVLLVCSRQNNPSPAVAALASTSLEFLAQAQQGDGTFVNRREASGRWSGPSSSEDCWGRALWALGTTVARSGDEGLRERARQLFERSVDVRSSWSRSMSFALFGAAEVLEVDGAHRRAWALVAAAATRLDNPGRSATWCWSERRLTYANAALAEAQLVAGSLLGDDRQRVRGLRQLAWLVALETPRGHLSVTPVSGRDLHSAPAMFDQQPIEVAALSDACVRAWAATGDEKWRDALATCVDWYSGSNDGGVVMFDPRTGGGYDGLTEGGANMNQGAESTIALLTTLQHAERLDRVGP